jgi:hypothetical protein
MFIFVIEFFNTTDMSNYNNDTKPWETTVILGDNGLAKIIGVSQRTVLEWRLAGKITGRPLGIKKDGKPAYFTYNWNKVKEEIRANINLKKVQDKIQ